MNQLLLQRVDQLGTESCERFDFLRQDGYRLADLSIAGDAGVFLVGEAEVVADDVTFLDGLEGSFFLLAVERGQQFDTEIAKGFFTFLKILEGVPDLIQTHNFVGEALNNDVAMDRFQGGFQSRQSIFVGVREQAVGDLVVLVLIDQLRDFNLLVDDVDLAGEVGADVRAATVRAEQSQGVNTVFPLADMAGDAAKQVFTVGDRFRPSARLVFHLDGEEAVARTAGAAIEPIDHIAEHGRDILLHGVHDLLLGELNIGVVNELVVVPIRAAVRAGRTRCAGFASDQVAAIVADMPLVRGLPKLEHGGLAVLVRASLHDLAGAACRTVHAERPLVASFGDRQLVEIAETNIRHGGHLTFTVW